MTNKLLEDIKALCKFGQSIKVECDDPVSEVKKLLIRIYNFYLECSPLFENVDDNFRQEVSYDDIRKITAAIFLDFGWYHTVLNPNELSKEADVATGDAIDDLTDIIKDMMEVKWCFENTTEGYAIWKFCFLMKHHSEQHLVDLLKYIKDKDE